MSLWRRRLHIAMWSRFPAVSSAVVAPPGTATVWSLVLLGSQVVAYR
jgi:hypothetical protein